MMTSPVGSVFALAATPEGGTLWMTVIPYALILGIFYFIILLPMKRKQQKVQEFLDGLKVGDKIITTGGIHGQITRLGDMSVQLQIADKVRVEVARAAVGGYQGQEPVVEPLGGAAEQTK
ncbi:MAG TPA: preprotein translocase subunit YajC [Vicinamibacterales bacterium]|jgi:preprotein translocase subunit YajC